MQTEANEVEITYYTAVDILSGGMKTLPVSRDAPLFVVGPNGAGKSGLMLQIYHNNHANAVRIAAHRQTWMESNFVPFSPQDKVANERNVKGKDQQANARWKEWNSSIRSGLVIANLIEADNALSRKVREEAAAGNSAEAERLATENPPLEIISSLFVSAQFPARSRVSFDRRGCQAFVWDQAVAVLAKLNGSRSEMSASDARCGNSLRMWRK